MSALLSPINLLTLWNYGGLCPPSLFKERIKYEKYQRKHGINFFDYCFYNISFRNYSDKLKLI